MTEPTTSPTRDRWHASWKLLIDAIVPPGPLCRDCADENGVCPTDKLPCDPTDRAIELVRRLRLAQAAQPSADAPRAQPAPPPAAEEQT